MKQFMLMLLVSGLGCTASLTEPFWGLLLYYTFAVLRPQYMWQWALPVELRWSLFAALVTLLGVALNSRKMFEKVQWNPIASLTICYGLFMMLSVVTAYDTVTAQTWGIEYGKIILMALMVVVVTKHLWQVKAMAMMMMLMLGYIAWEMNSLYIFDGRLNIFHYGYGGLDNNGAGLMLAMGMPMAYVFGVTAPRFWQRGFCWFLAVLMLHALLMSYSRGAMIAALVGVVWLLLNHRPRWQAAAITIVLCAAISVLAGKEIRERFLSTRNYQTDYSAQSRLASWKAAWELAWERPLIGQGIRNSNQFTYYYGADQRGRTIHNQFLQVAADSGIPAAGVYITIIGLSLVHLQHSKTRSRRFLEQEAYDLDISDEQADMIMTTHRIALGCQSSLIIFTVGAVFLSLEIVELPWLIMTLAGLLPNVLNQHLDDIVQQHTGGIIHRPAPGPLRPILVNPPVGWKGGA